jgi:hypothetical protein
VAPFEYRLAVLASEEKGAAIIFGYDCANYVANNYNEKIEVGEDGIDKMPDLQIQHNEINDKDLDDEDNDIQNIINVVLNPQDPEHVNEDPLPGDNIRTLQVDVDIPKDITQAALTDIGLALDAALYEYLAQGSKDPRQVYNASNINSFDVAEEDGAQLVNSSVGGAEWASPEPGLFSKKKTSQKRKAARHRGMVKQDHPVPPNFNDDMKQTWEYIWIERPPLTVSFIVSDVVEECYKEYNKGRLQNEEEGGPKIMYGTSLKFTKHWIDRIYKKWQVQSTMAT